MLNISGNEEPVADAVEQIQAWLDGAEPHLDFTLEPAVWGRNVRRVGVGLMAFGLLYWLPLPLRILRRARGDG